MRALFIREYGGPEKIECGELPMPEPGPGEVLVRVKTAALNHLDLWVRRGRPGSALKRPHILGSDLAGTLEKFGHGVAAAGPSRKLSLGAEVVADPGVGCGACEYCRRGMPNECPDFQLLGFQRPGVFAEFAVVSAANVYPKPKLLNWEEAAALPLAHLTAWHMLFSRARLRSGESVLIHGIGGGVATAALQLCTATGAAAIVTSSSEEKLAYARALGARGGVNYEEVSESEELAARVRELNGGRGVDVVVDTVGAATLAASLAALRRGGRLVNCGVTGGAHASLNMRRLYWDHLSIIGSTMGAPDDFRRLLCLVETTGLRPVVDRVYPLAEGRAATERMENGAQRGKLVLQVSE